MGLHEEVNLILENHDLRKTSFRKDVLNVFLSNRGRVLEDPGGMGIGVPSEGQRAGEHQSGEDLPGREGRT